VMLRAALLTLTVALVPACDARPGAPPAALVFAAASLTSAFEELAAAFEVAQPPARVELHFAGSASLVLQLREGAPADLFASADAANMQRALALGAAVGAPRDFAANRLVIVTPPGNPRGIAHLADLARDDLAVALCGPEVPAGRYARAALASAGVTLRPVSDEPSVKAVIAKLQLGEVDAGIVYVTDALAAGDSVHAVPLPAAQQVVARYPLVVLDGGVAHDTAAAFAEFVLSRRGQTILAAHGFAPP